MTFTGTLTADQLAHVSSVGADWMRVALSTDRCDRPAAEAAVRAACRAAGWDEPQLVVWMDSPLGGVVAAAAVRDWLKPDQLDELPQVEYEIRRQLTEQLGERLAHQLQRQIRAPFAGQLWGLTAQVRQQLRRQLEGQEWDRLRDELRDEFGDWFWSRLTAELIDPWHLPNDMLWERFRDWLVRQYGNYRMMDESGSYLPLRKIQDEYRPQVWRPLQGPFWDRLRDHLGDQLRDQLEGQPLVNVGEQLQPQLRAWHHNQLRGPVQDQLKDLDRRGIVFEPWSTTPWVVELAVAIAGLPECERLTTMAAAIRETGWWWPIRDAVVLTDRPTVLSRDQRGRLHNATGPALAYADGYHGHWWHGTAVPADLIEGDGWDIHRISTERNTELRRCAIERRG